MVLPFLTLNSFITSNMSHVDQDENFLLFFSVTKRRKAGFSPYRNPELCVPLPLDKTILMVGIFENTQLALFASIDESVELVSFRFGLSLDKPWSNSEWFPVFTNIVIICFSSKARWTTVTRLSRVRIILHCDQRRLSLLYYRTKSRSVARLPTTMIFHALLPEIFRAPDYR